MNTLANFAPEHFYHVFNRTNNKEPLFRSDENRRYFLQQYIKYITPFAQTYSYVLLPNHFHFLISINSISELRKAVQNTDSKARSKIERQFTSCNENGELIHQLITSRFSRLFSSYSLSYNKMYERNGNLFSRPFKRSLVMHESKFGYLQFYIHRNITKHRIDKNWKKYAWSSYPSFLSDQDTFINKNYVFEYFGGKTKFIEFHEIESYKLDSTTGELGD